MSLRMLSGGALTTVQDVGRVGQRRLGVGSCGATDAYSVQVANLLVGNPPYAAALEITLSGPRVRFERSARIALCGGAITAHWEAVELPGWRPISVPAGTEIALGAIRRGVRTYLAVQGGLDVPDVLDSASTDLRGQFGGWHGRPLRGGDLIPVKGAATSIDALDVSRWWIDPRPDLDFDLPGLLHVSPGIDATQPGDALFDGTWTVDPASNRQGLRLQGPVLSIADRAERVSSPVVPGTVQLPPDGQPIVLLADAQTMGGYPRIGQVALADLPRAAQLRPGETLRFAPCSIDAAWQRWRDQRQRLARIAIAIDRRLARPTHPR